MWMQMRSLVSMASHLKTLSITSNMLLSKKTGNRTIRYVLVLMALSHHLSIQAAVTFVTKPYLQNPAPDAMTVMWVTDNKCLSWVEFGESLQLEQKSTQSFAGLITADRINKVRLKNLKPATRYYYKVMSKEIVTLEPYKVTFGNTISSSVSYFITPGENPKQTSMLILNDLHERPESIGKLLSLSKQDDYEFVFFNGDVFNYVTSEGQLVDKFITPCASAFASVKPFLQVRGNHETRGAFARNYFDYFQSPEEKTYYTFTRGPVIFIVLDSGEDKADNEAVYGGLVDFDAYRQEQAQWLEQVLQSEECKNALYKVVLMHIPPLYSNGWHGTNHCKELFVPLFNRYGIDMVISGHTHNYGVYSPVAGLHDFAVCIGGGPEDGKRTLIKLKADETMLFVQMLNDTGVEVGRYKINGKVSVPEENLMLYRLGDGSRELNTTDGYPVFLDEYELSDTTFRNVRTLALPVTINGSNKRFTGVGSALNMGYITRSADKRFVVLGGYDCNVGEKPWGKPASEANRVVALVDAEGYIDTSTALNHVFNTKDIRSAVSSDGTDIWVSGNGGLSDNGGVFYTTKGSSSGILLNNEGGNTTTRNLRIFNDQLYVSRDTEILQVGNNLPKTFGQVFTDITGNPRNVNGSDFFMADLNEMNPGQNMILYFIDATNGIVKYSRVNGNWILNGIYKGMASPRAVEGFVSGGNVHLFVVCGNNTPNGDGVLYSLVDVSGFNQPISGKQVLLADYTGSKKTIRSVSWAPRSGSIQSKVDIVAGKPFKAYARDNMLCVESELQDVINIYDIAGRKLRSCPIVSGFNKIGGFESGQLVILKIREHVQKVIF